VIAVPQKATTVILLRERIPKGFEVFLLKRHERSVSWPGNFVYPGGKIDPNDGRPEIYSFCRGFSLQEVHQILGDTISPEESLGHWIAGLRELFEEAGVLLAYDEAGNPFLLQNTIGREKVLRYRNSLEKKELTLLQIAREENFLFALDQLHYYAHWITPEALPQRFDTRFFLARHPAGQDAIFDHRETTAGRWLTPQKALEGNLKAEVILAPPTLKTLEDLSQFETVDDVFKSMQEEKRAILPVSTKISDQPILVFPWDPDYEIFRRRENPVHVEHGRPSGPNDNTTRLLLKQGRWLPYCRC